MRVASVRGGRLRGSGEVEIPNLGCSDMQYPFLSC